MIFFIKSDFAIQNWLLSNVNLCITLSAINHIARN